MRGPTNQPVGKLGEPEKEDSKIAEDGGELIDLDDEDATLKSATVKHIQMAID